MKQLLIKRNTYSCINCGVCLPSYREFYKNLLVILDVVSLRTFEEKTCIQDRFCKLFDLHDDENIYAYLMKLSNKNIHSGFGLSYQTVMNNQSCTSNQKIEGLSLNID
jgi:hypothetical protein